MLASSRLKWLCKNDTHKVVGQCMVAWCITRGCTSEQVFAGLAGVASAFALLLMLQDENSRLLVEYSLSCLYDLLLAWYENARCGNDECKNDGCGNGRCGNDRGGNVPFSFFLPKLFASCEVSKSKMC